MAHVKPNRFESEINEINQQKTQDPPSRKDSFLSDLKDAGLKPKRKNEPLEQFSIRLSQADWKALQDHFSDKGLSAAAGIRSVLINYIDGNKLRQ